MRQDNRETMQRAIGIIEGASYGAGVRVQDALITAVEMLDAILNDKEEESPIWNKEADNEQS